MLYFAMTATIRIRGLEIPNKSLAQSRPSSIERSRIFLQPITFVVCFLESHDMMNAPHGLSHSGGLASSKGKTPCKGLEPPSESFKGVIPRAPLIRGKRHE